MLAAGGSAATLAPDCGASFRLAIQTTGNLKLPNTWRVRLVVRTQPSQGWCTGSTPVRAAIAHVEHIYVHKFFKTRYLRSSSQPKLSQIRAPKTLPPRTRTRTSPRTHSVPQMLPSLRKTDDSGGNCHFTDLTKSQSNFLSGLLSSIIYVLVAVVLKRDKRKAEVPH
jgi:hypothetical protein